MPEGDERHSRVKRLYTDRSYRHYTTLGCIDPPAKKIHYSPKLFIALCEENGVLFRRGVDLTPYSKWMAPENGGSKKVGKDYMIVKPGVARKGEPNSHAYGQAMFTTEGVTWIARRLAGKSLPPK